MKASLMVSKVVGTNTNISNVDEVTAHVHLVEDEDRND
jgi:hypothetical protein